MFDYVECHYELPISNEIKEKLGEQNWQDIKFQTKSFSDPFLNNYTIEDDGQVYKEDIERELVGDTEEEAEIKETSLGINKVEWTGELYFYYDFFREEGDYWLEFKALLWKGEVKEVELCSFKRVDNEYRKEVQEKFIEAGTKRAEREKKWWWRFFLMWKAVVSFVLGSIRWCVGLVARSTWTVERWLTGGTKFL